MIKKRNNYETLRISENKEISFKNQENDEKIEIMKRYCEEAKRDFLYILGKHLKG